MELILAAYLVVAGVLGAGVKHGVIKDDAWEKTLAFEKDAAKRTHDYLQEREERLTAKQVAEEINATK